MNAGVLSDESELGVIRAAARAVRGGAGRAGAAALSPAGRALPSPVWPARVLAVVHRLGLSVRISFEQDQEPRAGDYGLIDVVDGAIVGASSSDPARRLGAAEAVLAEPGLADVAGALRDAGGTPERDLAMQRELLDRLSGSAGYRAHLATLVAPFVAAPAVITSFLPPPVPPASGRPAAAVPLLGVLFDACAATDGQAARRVVGPDARLVAPDGLPDSLRTTLTPRAFGKLFFLLEEGLTLDEAVARSGRSPAATLAAVAVGLAVGAIVADVLPGLQPAVAAGAAPGQREDGERTPPTAEPPTLPPEAKRSPHGATPPRVATVSDSGETIAALIRAQSDIATRRTEPSSRGDRIPRTRFELHDEQFGPVRLCYRIGVGGMGEVFLGVHTGHEGFQRVLAVKRLLPHLDAQSGFVDMFLEEARLAALLDHPNIIKIFQFGRFNGSHGLLMEFVHGASIRAIVRRCRQLGQPAPPTLVRYVGAEVARALHYAASLTDFDGTPVHLVHRDITPGNVLVSFEGAVKVIDFGIAERRRSVGRASRSLLAGKSSYMPPEMLQGRPVDGRSDIFGLGVLLYELLTGAPCFRRDTTEATVEAILAGDHEPAARVRPEAPPELADAIERCLSVDPADRFPDGAALRRALLAVPHGGATDPVEVAARVVDALFGSVKVAERRAIGAILNSLRGSGGGPDTGGG